MISNISGENKPPADDFITIVQAPRCVLTKQVDRNKPLDKMFTPYGDAYWFNLREMPVNGLDDIGWLLDRLLDDYTRAAIFGAIIDPARADGVRKLSRRDFKNGYDATLRACAHRWAGFDMDDVERPDGVAAADLCACARFAIGTLPSAFHGVRCIVQATSGHGLKPGSRLRLWFWFSRPVTQSEIKVWLRGCPIDRATCRTVQPVYTARPIFTDGGADHLPYRLAWVNGRGFVDVPHPDLLKPPPRPPAPPPGSVTAATESDAQTFVLASLARLAAARDGRRHDARWNEARLLGGIAAEADLDDETIIQWMVDALPPQANYESEVETIREGIEAGRLAPMPIHSKGGMLTALPVSGGSGGVAKPKVARSRSSQSSILVLRDLTQRVPMPEILARVRAHNAKRESPLSANRLNETIAWAIARFKESNQ
jgi:hypothetical protein